MSTRRAQRPNVVFVMGDDHAAHARRAAGGRINRTPGIEPLVEGAMRSDSCCCTNSICTPRRAAPPTEDRAAHDDVTHRRPVGDDEAAVSRRDGWAITRFARRPAG